MLYCRLAVRFFSLIEQLQSPLLTAVEAGQDSATSLPSAERRSLDRLTMHASLCTARINKLPKFIPHGTVYVAVPLKHGKITTKTTTKTPPHGCMLLGCLSAIVLAVSEFF